MELEDAILSTLKEIEEKGKSQLLQSKKKPFEVIEKKECKEIEVSTNHNHTTKEEMFLLSTRERLLVLFEGFQAPNNTNIEAKIDLTLNFLEYMLASIDSRIDEMKKGTP
ncbi:MAG: hypothetical protein L3I99_05380 [Sulfurimonas sp.]|nr:hypothetical protein [Sulfurimonas sp.]